MRRPVLRVDLQREPSQRAPILTVGLEDAHTVTGEDREDPFQRIVRLAERGIYHLRPQRFQVLFEHRLQQRLFAFEEMVEAAAVDPGMRQQVRHAGSREASLPEKEQRRVDQILAGRRGFGHQKSLDVSILLVFT